MTKYIFSLGLTLFLLIGSLSAQQLTLSPYSRYAIGEIFHNASARHFGMGGIGIAADNFFSINRVNPASYADIVFTTMDFSGFGQLSNFSSNTDEEYQATGGFQHLAFGFPTNKNLVFTLGFSPYSAVGYQIIDRQEITLDDSTFLQQTQYIGEGGTNQAFIGLGARFLDNKLKVGVSGQYIFGGITQDWLSTVTRTDSVNLGNYQTVQILEDRYLRGLSSQAGVIYQDTLSRKSGITYRIGAMVDYNFYLREDNNTTYTNSVIVDTLSSRSFELLERQIPLKYGIGFSLHKFGSWTFGADLTMQNWTDFEPPKAGIQLGQEVRVAAGGEIIPKFDSFKYYNRISYRFGGYYKQTYLNGFGDVPVSDIGITFGFGLPSSRKGNSLFNQGRATSKVNLGFALGQRASLSAGHPVQELYARFNLGISLNDRWFIRRVVD